MVRRRKRGVIDDPQPIEVSEAPSEVPEALLGVPEEEPRSLADEHVLRAEGTRMAAFHSDRTALIYIGDAILALTERLAELDR